MGVIPARLIIVQPELSLIRSLTGELVPARQAALGISQLAPGQIPLAAEQAAVRVGGHAGTAQVIAQQPHGRSAARPYGDPLRPGVIVAPHAAGGYVPLEDLPDVHRHFPIDHGCHALPVPVIEEAGLHLPRADAHQAVLSIIAVLDLFRRFGRVVLLQCGGQGSLPARCRKDAL